MTDKTPAEPAEEAPAEAKAAPVEAKLEPKSKLEPGTVEVIVIGDAEIDGRATGETLTLPVVQAWQLIRGGHVALVKGGKAMAPAEQAKAIDKLLQEV